LLDGNHSLVGWRRVLVVRCLAIYLFNWDRVNQVRRGHPALALLVLLPGIIGIFLG